MTKVSFYVGSQNSLQARLLLACKLTEKARAHNMQVYIHTDGYATTKLLDELMWTWSELSFMPHAEPPNEAPVLIGHDFEPIENCDYLINLSMERPLFFSRFERMAEILDQTPEILEMGRDRYRFYQDRGYELDYYKL